MEIKPTLEAPAPAAGLDSGRRETLPPLVVGERPAISRQHAWPASLFYTLSYFVAVGLAAGAVGWLGYGVLTADPGRVGVALLMAVGAPVQWRLATEVQHFSRWGWYGAMAELAAAAAANLWAMVDGNPVGGAIGFAIDLMWIDHFWNNRDQFDIDLDG